MKIWGLLASLLITLISCNSKKAKQNIPLRQLDIASKQFVADSNIFYLPMDSLYMLGSYKEADTFIKRKLSNILLAAKEPVLQNIKLEQTSFRFLWARPFDPAVIVRINIQEGMCFANVKVVEKDYKELGVYSFQLVMDTIVLLKNKFCTDFYNSFKKTNFLNVQTKDTNAVEVEDETVWLVEGMDKTRYHFIYRPYKDKNQFNGFEFVKYLYDIGKSLVEMRNRKELPRDEQ